jgi:Na+/glutamate symporter
MIKLRKKRKRKKRKKRKRNKRKKRKRKKRKKRKRKKKKKRKMVRTINLMMIRVELALLVHLKLQRNPLLNQHIKANLPLVPSKLINQTNWMMLTNKVWLLILLLNNN